MVNFQQILTFYDHAEDKQTIIPLVVSLSRLNCLLLVWKQQFVPGLGQWKFWPLPFWKCSWTGGHYTGDFLNSIKGHYCWAQKLTGL